MLVQDIAGATLASIEYIPLTLYKPHGLALILWVWSGDIDLRGCTACPWKALYEDRRSHDLISINIESIIKRAEELSVDMVFLHGGEPVSKPWLSPLVEVLRQYGIKLGLKARVEMLQKLTSSQLIKSIEALLIEIPSKAPKDLLEKALYNSLESLSGSENLYVELLFTDPSLEKSFIDNLAELNRSLGRISPGRQPVPIGFHAQSLAEHEMLSLVRIVNKTCVTICYVIESSSKIYPEEIRCPRCGTIVARRRDVLVIPLGSNGTECPRCGGKIFRSKPNRIKRAYPVLSPIYLL